MSTKPPSPNARDQEARQRQLSAADIRRTIEDGRKQVGVAPAEDVFKRMMAKLPKV